MSIFTTQPGSDTPQTVLEAVGKVMNKPTQKPVARIQKDSFVTPNVGPHKGMRHKVTKIHEDGSMSVVPWDLHPSAIKYRMGVAKATPDQVEAITEQVDDESMLPESAPTDETPLTVDQEKKIALGQMHGSYKGHAAAMRKKHGISKEPTNYVAHRKNYRERATVADLKEGVNTPSVKEYHEDGVHKGWKAMNKHGKTKFFGKEFKSSAMKHAGLNEGEEVSKFKDADSKKQKEVADELKKAAKGLNVTIDEQQLDELSRATLGRYAKAAHNQIVDKTAEAVRSRQHQADDERRGDHEGAKWWKNNAQKAGTKAAGREAGHAKAVSKLMKESHPHIAAIIANKRGN